MAFPTPPFVFPFGLNSQTPQGNVRTHFVRQIINGALDLVYRSVTHDKAHPSLLWVGKIEMQGMATPQTGWLLCNGAAVSRETYAELFAAIGTNYGAGDGSTTFNLPPGNDASPIGLGGSLSFDANRITGANTKNIEHAHQLPLHVHSDTHTHPHPHTHPHDHDVTHNHPAENTSTENLEQSINYSSGGNLATVADDDHTHIFDMDPITVSTSFEADGESPTNTSGRSTANTGNPTTQPNTGNAGSTTQNVVHRSFGVYYVVYSGVA